MSFDGETSGKGNKIFDQLRLWAGRKGTRQKGGVVQSYHFFSSYPGGQRKERTKEAKAKDG